MQFTSHTFSRFEFRLLKDPAFDVPFALRKAGIDLSRRHFRSDDEETITFWQANGPYTPPSCLKPFISTVDGGVFVSTPPKVRWKLQTSLYRYRMLTGFIPPQALNQAGIWLVDRNILSPMRKAA